MNKSIPAVLIFLLLTGCEIGCDTQCKAKKHVCSMEDLELVKAEMAICMETGYFSTYCMDQAKIDHCPLKPQEAE